MTDKSFNIRIADFTVHIDALYDCAYEFCKDYIVSDEDFDFSVQTSQEEIEKERLEGLKNGEDIPGDYPDSYLELLCIYRKIAQQMIKRDTLLVHGSAISYKGKGILFIAESGTGKSTHAAHWKAAFPEDVIIINDDKPLVRITDGQVFIYGTPWSGKKGINTNTKAPLQIIYSLERGKENLTESMTDSEIWRVLIMQSFKPYEEKENLKVISILDRLKSCVSIKTLKCTDSAESVCAAKKGLGQL